MCNICLALLDTPEKGRYADGIFEALGVDRWHLAAADQDFGTVSGSPLFRSQMLTGSSDQMSAQIGSFADTPDFADVPGNSGTGSTLTIGGSVSDTIEVAGDTDWFAVTLTAGESYVFELSGTNVAGELADTYLRLYGTNSQLLAENDDISYPTNTDSQITFTAPSSGTYYVSAGGYGNNTGNYVLSAAPTTPPSTYTYDEIANYLIEGNSEAEYWDQTTITYNIEALGSAPAGQDSAQNLAILAFNAWAGVSGLTFQRVTSGGDIVFGDTNSGAYASNSTYINASGDRIIDGAFINVNSNWSGGDVSVDSYTYQTFIHEIGHALGLGHAGPYNGSATYGVNNLYANDTWGTTVMSYFSQSEAGFGTEAYVMTPQIADILAVQQVYGTNGSTHTGNSVYGFNTTLPGTIYDATQFAVGSVALTILDEGGIDTLDFSGATAASNINLNAETHSDINGSLNVLSIASGTIIEDAIGGSGNDVITGNSANNELVGNGGSDTLNGGDGNDELQGGTGADSLIGGDGSDTAIYSGSSFGVTLSLLAGSGSGGDAAGDTFDSIENVIGSTLGDNITGSGGANRIHGLDGADILDGGAGNDTLFGGAGADTLIGGSGTDVANYIYSAQAVTVNLVSGGSAGEAIGDSYFGIENVYGSAYGDTLVGNAARNLLLGGGGNDSLDGGGGNDVLFGGAGADNLIGGSGIDVATYASATQAVTVNLVSGGSGGDAAGDIYSGVENIYGSIYGDTLIGDAANNLLIGGGGADVLDGGGGNDVLFGGAGADAMTGGSGTDVATYFNSAQAVTVNLASGGSGGDAAGDTYSGVEKVYGSAFDDTLIGDAGNNVLTGAGGADTLDGGGGKDVLVGGDGGDILSGGDGIDVLVGDEGADDLNGGAGNDRLYGGVGADILNGGSGIDVASYLFSAQAVTANLASGGSAGEATGDSYIEIENIYGSSYGDTLVGDAVRNLLIGNDGDDTLDGGGGNDVLFGGAGADTLIGGSGIDVATYFSATQAVTVNLVSGGSTGEANGDTYSAIENIYGSNYGDTLSGDAENNLLIGSGGDDTLDGGGGNDVLFGGTGADTLIGGSGIDVATYSGAAQAVTANLVSGGSTGDANGDTYSGIENIYGSEYGDTLTGDAANNQLTGAGGDDILDGAGGNDLFIGGAGSDTFVFSQGGDADKIADFELGVDQIDLTDFGYSSLQDVLNLATQVGANTELALSATDVLTLSNIDLNQLTSSDFLL